MRVTLKREFNLGDWRKVKKELTWYFSLLKKIEMKERELKRLLKNQGEQFNESGY